MTELEFCIRFMDLKQRWIQDSNYFTEEDRKELQKATKIPLLKVVRNAKLILTEPRVRFWNILNGGTCPFCTIQDTENETDTCEGCGYGERHGICSGDEKNDYDTIYHELRDLEEDRDCGYRRRLEAFEEDLQKLVKEYNDPDRHGLV